MEFPFFTLLLTLGVVFHDSESSHRRRDIKTSPAGKKLHKDTYIVHFKGRTVQEMTEEAKKLSTSLSTEDYVPLLPDILMTNSNSSQQHVVQLLEETKSKRSSKLQYERLLATNKVIVQFADPGLIDRLKATPGVELVEKDRPFDTDKEESTYAGSLNSRADDIKWNVKMVKAPEVWKEGYRGQGVVVGIVDTGVRGTHKALAGKFRKEFGWHDPSGLSSEPVDSNSHGTHVAATVVGDYGVGVAPDAKLIACRMVNKDLVTTVSSVWTCLEWMYCPRMGNKTDCSKRPKVINGSWGVAFKIPKLDELLQLFINSGVILVFAAGNNGPNCSSIWSPFSFSKDTITVGNVNSNGMLTFTSSRGPAPDGRIKPDICAPGRDIISAGIKDDDILVKKSGTSMSAPHVTGVAALLASKDPKMTQAEFYAKITKTAEPHTGILSDDCDRNCGGDGFFPNSNVGWGLINALKALHA